MTGQVIFDCYSYSTDLFPLINLLLMLVDDLLVTNAVVVGTFHGNNTSGYFSDTGYHRICVLLI